MMAPAPPPHPVPLGPVDATPHLPVAVWVLAALLFVGVAAWLTIRSRR